MDSDQKTLLGDYFILTAGYSANGGLVNEKRRAILFISEGNNLYRPATPDEVMINAKGHPVLQLLK